LVLSLATFSLFFVRSQKLDVCSLLFFKLFGTSNACKNLCALEEIAIVREEGFRRIRGYCVQTLRVSRSRLKSGWFVFCELRIDGGTETIG
jgi:hypothetical protein